MQEFPASLHAFFQAWGRMKLSGFLKMLYLAKYPGITDRRTTDHDPVHTIPVPVFQRPFRTVDIAVAEDGDMNAGIVLHFCDQRPVRVALVHLIARTSVDGQGL